MEIKFNLRDGSRVLFNRGDGTVQRDTVRGGVFIQQSLLQPYADDEHAAAVVLTQHSWCYVRDIIKVEEA